MRTIELLLRQPWVARVGWTLLHFLWQGTLIAVVYAVVRGLFGRALSPRARYALACLALTIMMAAPPLTLLAAGSAGAGNLPLPVWRVSGDIWQRALPWLVVIWLAGVVVTSARLVSSWRMSARLRSVAVGPVPQEWQRALEELIHRMRVSAPVRLVASALVSTPAVVGWLRPVILMPVTALTGLPPDQVRALLAHELAHIRRHDYLANILQSIAEAVLFYHPAVWWVSEQIRMERELCCDDLAVDACGDVLVYARALADLDTNRRARWNAAMAADGGSLVNRIRRLVGEPEPASHLPGPGAAWAFSLLWMAGMGAAALHGAPSAASVAHRAFVVPSRPAAAPVLLAPPPAISTAAALLLFDPFFLPQQPPAPPVALAPDITPQKNGSVEGVVLNLKGEPVKRADVRLADLKPPVARLQSGYVETTDDKGRFSIEDVPPGSYTLTANKMGYLPGAYGARTSSPAGATVTIAEGASLKNLEIKMTPQAVIAGRVTDRDGQPAAGARLMLFRLAYEHGRKQLRMEPRGRGPANDQGRFSLSNITAGRYYLCAVPGEKADGLPPGIEDLRTYYPNAPDIDTAAPLDIAAGARLEAIDIKLLRDRVYSVKGVVTVNGAVVQSSMLSVTPKVGIPIGSPGGTMVEVRNGSFSMNALQPGTYTVRTLPSGVVAGMVAEAVGLSGSLDITIKDRNLDNVIVALQPGVELSGVFKVEDGDWQSLFGQSAATGNGTLSVALPSIGLLATETFASGAPMRANDDGTFQLRPVGAGEYVLNLTALPPGTYVKAMRYGVVDVTRAPLNLTSSGEKLEITLSKKAATVSGALRNEDGTPKSGVMVTVWPKNLDRGSLTWGIVSRFTDQNGAFQIAGLPPGEYMAAAWDDVESDIAGNPEFLDQFASQAATAKLTESAQASMDVKVIPRDKILAAIARLH